MRSDEVGRLWSYLERMLEFQPLELDKLERAMGNTHTTEAERWFLAGRLIAAREIHTKLVDALTVLDDSKNPAPTLLEIADWCRVEALEALSETATPTERENELRAHLGRIYTYTLAANRLQMVVQQVQSPQGRAKLEKQFTSARRSRRPHVTGAIRQEAV